MKGNNNLALWRKHRVVPQEFLKSGNNGLSSINSYWVFERLTEEFGEFEKGWGYEIDFERIDDISPFNFGETVLFSKVHTLGLKPWRLCNGNKVSGSVVVGHTDVMYLTKEGKPFKDSEYYKKSITDALTKWASLLGVGSDVYLDKVGKRGYGSTPEDIIESAQRNMERAKALGPMIKEILEYYANEENEDNIQVLQANYDLHFARINAEYSALNLDATKPLERLTKGLELAKERRKQSKSK